MFLGEAAPIDRAVHTWRAAAQFGPVDPAVERALRERLWLPLGNALPAGTKRLFLAPEDVNYLLTNPPAGPWTDYQFVTTVTGSSSDLAFSFRDDPGFMFLDNISVVSGAVPEPGTWAMMLLGFGAMGLAIRRDRKPKLANALT